MFELNSNLEIPKNSKNYFSERGLFRWQSDLPRCKKIINLLIFIKTKEEFVQFLLCEEEGERLYKDMTFLLDWPLESVLYSSLFYFFENEDSSALLKWASTCGLLVNRRFTDQVTQLFAKNNFADFLKKNRPLILYFIKDKFIIYVDLFSQNKNDIITIIDNLFFLLEINPIKKEELFQYFDKGEAYEFVRKFSKLY